MSVNKRGQVTLFIILGIVVFATVIAYIVWVEPALNTQKSVNLNFDACVKKVVSDGIENLAITGGFQNPTNYIRIKENDSIQTIPYFVYTNYYLETGNVEVPFPEEQFQKELAGYTQESIETCYSNNVKKLQEQGYNVEKGDISVDMQILPERVKVSINAPTTIESQEYENIEIEVPSEIYGILELSSNIIQKEVLGEDYDVDLINLMQIYTGYSIFAERRADTKIYTIQDNTYGVKYKFASQSKVIPTASELVDAYVEFIEENMENE